MEKVSIPNDPEKELIVNQLLHAAAEGIDVSQTNPKETSSEAVILANKIYRAKGRQALTIVQSAL